MSKTFITIRHEKSHICSSLNGATTKRRAGKRRAGNCRAGKRRAENWRAGKRRTL
mgnify:CR=1 FL=1